MNVQYFTHISNQPSSQTFKEISRDAVETGTEAMQWRNNIQHGDNDSAVRAASCGRGILSKIPPTCAI
jgi:hypothetical protein